MVLEYAESDEPIEAFKDPLLEHDVYVEALKERTPTRRREALVDDLLERNRRVVHETKAEIDDRFGMV